MLSRYVGGLICGAIADYILVKKYLSIVWIRRIFNSVCMLGPAIAMFVMAFPGDGSRCDVTLYITMMCLGMLLNGALTSGHFATPGDLAPNYAGTVFGISNTVSGGSIAYIVPVFIGAITNNNMTFEAWTIVFATASIIYVVTNCFYVFMVKGNIQPWNFDENQTRNHAEEMIMIKKANLAEPEDTNDF